MALGLILLVGRDSNRDGVGALVRIHRDGREQVTVVTAGSSYLSTSSRRVRIAVGEAGSVSVSIHWPSGIEQEVAPLLAGGFILVEGGPPIRIR